MVDMCIYLLLLLFFFLAFNIFSFLYMSVWHVVYPKCPKAFVFIYFRFLLSVFPFCSFQLILCITIVCVCLILVMFFFVFFYLVCTLFFFFFFTLLLSIYQWRLAFLLTLFFSILLKFSFVYSIAKIERPSIEKSVHTFTRDTYRLLFKTGYLCSFTHSKHTFNVCIFVMFFFFLCSRFGYFMFCT